MGGHAVSPVNWKASKLGFVEPSKEDGRKRLRRAEAVRAFLRRTGRFPEEEDLHTLVDDVAWGLSDEQVGDRSWLVRDASQLDGYRVESPPKRRGRPNLSPQLVEAVCRLVDELGPRNAALLLCIYDLDKAPALGRREVAQDEPFDVWEHVLRRLEKRLSEIRSSRTAKH